MSKFEKYMDDPDIINEPMVMREVHAIRMRLHDDTKGMTPEEHAMCVGEQRKHGL
jgi:hypothetical protein